MASMAFRPSSRGSGILVALCCLLGNGYSSRSYGYRFISVESIPVQFPSLASANVWDPEAWAPGEVLSFILLDAPEWTELSEDIQVVKTRIEEAMAAWEDIPTADIRWGITEIDPLEDLDEFAEDRHYIFPSVADSSSVLTFFKRGEDGIWRASKVNVRIGDVHIADPNVFRMAMLHELGHVVGLGHASVYSRGSRPEHLPDGLLSGSWRFDPVMSYGRVGRDRYRDYSAMLTPDDRIGASLVRPRDGWLALTGNIRGTVLLEDGSGAGLVHVLATRVRRDGTMGGSVGAFTNLFGEFVIGGLEAGDYVLVVRALEIERAHPNLLPWVRTGIRDTLWATPIAVSAGARAGPFAIVVSPGGERPIR